MEFNRFMARPLAPETHGGFAPTCSVVICTHDRPDHLDRCLNAVMRLNYSHFDVLVVDNASHDARTREVAARWGARYIVEPVVGLSRARNRGARACDTEVVAFLDDDAVPESEWLSNLAREFEDPLVMAVTGRILPLQIETESERLCALLGGLDFGGQERRRVDCQTPYWFEMANFGGVGDGGNMAFRRCVFYVWPGFHERLGRGAILVGGEEHYAFFSLIDRGYRMVYTPLAVVRHPFPCTMRDLRARHLRDLAAATGYIRFLFFEEPRHRRAVMRYAVEALRGVPRVWRGKVAGPRPQLVSTWRTVLAQLSGPLLYVKLRLMPDLTVNRTLRLNEVESTLDGWHPPNIEKRSSKLSPTE